MINPARVETSRMLRVSLYYLNPISSAAFPLEPVRNQKNQSDFADENSNEKDYHRSRNINLGPDSVKHGQVFLILIVSICFIILPHEAMSQSIFDQLFGDDDPSYQNHEANRSRNTRHYQSPKANWTRRVEKYHADSFRYRKTIFQQDHGKSDLENIKANYSRSDRGQNRSSEGADNESRRFSPNAGGEFCVRICDGYFFPLIKSSHQTK